MYFSTLRYDLKHFKTCQCSCCLRCHTNPSLTRCGSACSWFYPPPLSTTPSILRVRLGCTVRHIHVDISRHVLPAPSLPVVACVCTHDIINIQPRYDPALSTSQVFPRTELPAARYVPAMAGWVVSLIVFLVLLAPYETFCPPSTSFAMIATLSCICTEVLFCTIILTDSPSGRRFFFIFGRVHADRANIPFTRRYFLEDAEKWLECFTLLLNNTLPYKYEPRH